ncbi:hypothetical protein ACFE04_029619 [Oxalis oulophora]
MEIWLFLVTVLVCLRIGEAQSKSYFINCGSSSSVTINGRKWVGDVAPDSNLTLGSPGVAVNTTTLNGNSTLDPVYKSARIFTRELNYTFEGVHGNYVVRLHFCPFSFDGFDANKSSFGVSANSLQLISQLNVPGKISDNNLNMQRSDGNSSSSFSIIKEYILDINVAGNFVIKFAPTKGSFGFINAMEIIPVVDKLFPDSVGKVGGGEASLSGRGVETMYRLNVGGGEIKPNQDSDLYRSWEVDYSYMVTTNAGSEISNTSNITYSSMNDSSIAPLLVYETARTMSNSQVLVNRFNMSWKFKVDPDFDYLIRLHFCELVYDKASQRIFRIFINNRTAAYGVDIFAKAGGMNKAYHQDYFDAINSKIKTLWVQLGPDTATGASETDAILNGLEIFKLSRNGNLAYVEKFDSFEKSNNSNTRRLWIGVGAGVASIALLTVLSILICCFCKNRKTKTKDAKNTSPGWRPLFLHINSTPNIKGTTNHYGKGSMASVRVGKQFTLAEIRLATNNFDESLVIGVGGFGKVFKGETEDDGPALDHTHVSTAVKGSFGYLDPEYFRRQQLTEKSDVYSFGVVLFEVVCARPVINPTLPKDQINLAEWAMKWQKEKLLETIMDPRLKGKYSPESLEKFGEIAEKCLADEGKSRPTMGEVLWHLEYVLQLQEAWMSDQAGDSPPSDLEEGKSEGGGSLDEEVGLDHKMTEEGQSVTMLSSR